MHNFILGFFNFLRSFLHFMKIVCIFCVLMLLCYWIQNLTNSNWQWLAFISPFLAWLVETANKIYSVSFNLLGAVFELKYFSALLILVILSFSMNLIITLVNLIECGYKGAHFVYKKTEEIAMNKSLQADIENKEKKIKKYFVLINTKIKKQYSHQIVDIDISEQNNLMNKFITEKTSIKPMFFNGGFLYSFNDFDNIDTVLDILFKVLESKAPLDYSICIQVNNNMEQLQKLASLKHYGQITIAADTAFRYRYNTEQKYQTSQLGIFQNGNKTLEVHEFKEIL